MDLQAADGPALPRPSALVDRPGHLGDRMVVEPGHGAWVVGQAPCTVIGWKGAINYAEPTTTVA